MNNRPQSVVLTEDLEPWLEDHGLKLKDCKNLRIVIGDAARRVGVTIEGTYYLRNVDGQLYVDFDGPRDSKGERQAAQHVVSVPLLSWPPLTAVEGGLRAGMRVNTETEELPIGSVVEDIHCEMHFTRTEKGWESQFGGVHDWEYVAGNHGPVTIEHIPPEDDELP